MDSIKRFSMVLLSVVTVLGGIVLFTAFFGINVFDVFGGSSSFFKGLLGILLLANGLIGIGWFLGVRGKAGPKNEGS